MICDEAHRTTGVTLADEDESSFVRIHDNSYIRAAKRLYMTATPKLFNDEIKNAAKEKDAVLASMDDQSIYGPVFHRLGFGQAVALGLLTDYKVVVLAVPEDDISSLYQLVSAEDGELSLPDVAKLIGCWNALAKRKGQQVNSEYGSDLSPMRRAVMFCKDIKTSNWVASQFSDVVAKLVETSETAGSDLVVQRRHVDGAMNAVVRGEQLDWLKDETPTTEEAGSAAPICRVLTNARCLSEGVDVPSLDAVCF